VRSLKDQRLDPGLPERGDYAAQRVFTDQIGGRMSGGFPRQPVGKRPRPAAGGREPLGHQRQHAVSPGDSGHLIHGNEAKRVDRLRFAFDINEVGEAAGVSVSGFGEFRRVKP
jgi:hypothetical protein